MKLRSGNARRRGRKKKDSSPPVAAGGGGDIMQHLKARLMRMRGAITGKQAPPGRETKESGGDALEDMKHMNTDDLSDDDDDDDDGWD